MNLMYFSISMIHHKMLSVIGGLSLKWLVALMITVSGPLGVIFGEMMTGQWGAAGLAGVIASTVGAALVVIPRIMEQRRKNLETFSAVRDKETGQLITRMADLHEKELAFAKLQTAEATYVASLERQAKHDLLGELTAAQTALQILVTQIHKLGQDPMIEIRPVDYREIVGKVDKEIMEMRKTAVQVAQSASAALVDGPTAAAAVRKSFARDDATTNKS